MDKKVIPIPNSNIKNELEKYKIMHTIGKGTFGKVKLGIQKSTHIKVSIKILEKDKMLEEDDKVRSQREMAILKILNHQNIIHLYEIIETNTKYYIIMEYCKDGELFNYIVKKHHLSENEASYFFYQIINGIEYIHSKGIAHRDLKPENLLLFKNNKIKIIDFGLSNYALNKLLSTPCGSPCYASPEMISGNNYNGFKIDIWSSGIILYAMLYGYLPFEDPDNNILFDKILRGEIEYRSNVSKDGIDLIKKILVNDTNKRITIEEIKKHKFYLLGEMIYNKKINGNYYVNNYLLRAQSQNERKKNISEQKKNINNNLNSDNYSKKNNIIVNRGYKELNCNKKEKKNSYAKQIKFKKVMKENRKELISIKRDKRVLIKEKKITSQNPNSYYSKSKLKYNYNTINNKDSNKIKNTLLSFNKDETPKYNESKNKNLKSKRLSSISLSNKDNNKNHKMIITEPNNYFNIFKQKIALSKAETISKFYKHKDNYNSLRIPIKLTHNVTLNTRLSNNNERISKEKEISIRQTYTANINNQNNNKKKMKDKPHSCNKEYALIKTNQFFGYSNFVRRSRLIGSYRKQNEKNISNGGTFYQNWSRSIENDNNHKEKRKVNSLRKIIK